MTERFWSLLTERGPAPRVLECGTRRQGDHAVHHRALVLEHAPGAQYVGLDAAGGEDVDVVADLHDLSSLVALAGPFDAILCCSVLEHVRRPWEVARQLASVCRPGAPCYVQTHQTFPLHDYPGDYFRFSADALREVFSREAGWEVIEAGHVYPCKVLPLGNEFAHAKDWNFEAPAFLNSWVLARRTP